LIMTYLVVCAMKEEQDAFLKLFDTQIETAGNISHLCINDGKDEIYCMLGGIGKVSMAYMLGSILNTRHFDLIINVGVAGTINGRLKPFTTLIADRCAYHDVDVTAFGYSYGQMCQCPLYFESDRKAIKLGLESEIKELATGLILSGDSFMTKENTDLQVLDRFESPVAVDMESAAIAQVSYLAKIPFVIIRSISDDASNNEGNKNQYEDNLDKASERAATVVKYIVSNYSR
jgi:adenosylhomocysteine nucleosidase